MQNTHTISNRMLKYFAMFTIAVKNSSFETQKLFFHLIVVALRVAILLILYSYAFRYFGKSSLGIDFQTTAWSITTYFVFFAFNLRFICKDIGNDIYSGKIEIFLNKPFRYVFYACIMRFGNALLEGTVALFFAILFLVLFVGLPVVTFNMMWFIYALIIFNLGIILALVVYTCVGLSAFWLEDSDPLFWIVDKSIMILGGSYVPFALFPEIIKSIALYSPFGSMLFVTHIFYANFGAVAPSLISIQLFWIVILSVLIFFLFRSAQKRMFVNGG